MRMIENTYKGRPIGTEKGLYIAGFIAGHDWASLYHTGRLASKNLHFGLEQSLKNIHFKEDKNHELKP